MNTENYLDLEICARNGEVPKDVTKFRIRVDDGYHKVDSLSLTGRELLSMAKMEPVEEYLVYVKLIDGKLEIIELDKPFDLSCKGVERFLTSKCTSPYSFEIDGVPHKWNASFITGRKLKEIAEVNPDQFDIWKENREGEDQKIKNDQFVNLCEEGPERFFTVLSKTTAGDSSIVSLVPRKDSQYLKDNKIQYQERMSGQHMGIVLISYKLPENRFNHESTDILVLLPAGYPEVPPDMFYCNPWLELLGAGRYPNQADVFENYFDIRWQRWSRHNNNWRCGKDGIWTMVKRIDRAIEEA